jgi:hypothetical protein
MDDYVLNLIRGCHDRCIDLILAETVQDFNEKSHEVETIIAGLGPGQKIDHKLCMNFLSLLKSLLEFSKDINAWQKKQKLEFPASDFLPKIKLLNCYLKCDLIGELLKNEEIRENFDQFLKEILVNVAKNPNDAAGSAIFGVMLNLVKRYFNERSWMDPAIFEFYKRYNDALFSRTHGQNLTNTNFDEIPFKKTLNAAGGHVIKDSAIFTDAQERYLKFWSLWKQIFYGDVADTNQTLDNNPKSV